MNSPTSSSTAPAATPRTGRRESALPPPGAKTQSLPFAAIPHHIAADPRLSPTDLRVLAALLYHARNNASCWASDRRLAQRCSTAADRGPASVGTIQRALKRLEACGHIAREATPETLTGRRIWLAWRAVPLRAGEQTPMRAGEQQRNVIVREKKEKTKSPERSRPEPELVLVAIPSNPADGPPPLIGVGAAVSAPAPIAASEPRTAALEGPVERGPLSPREAVRGGPTSSPAAELSEGTKTIPAGLMVEQINPSTPGDPPVSAAQATPRTIPVTPSVPTPHSSPREAGSALSLTAEQKARLDALPTATRDLVLTWLLTGDPILVAEARKKLVPPRPRPEAPQTLPELLANIRADPSYPARAADWLCTALNDRKSYSGFKSRCEEAWRGELNPDQLVSAYQQALGPRTKNPGAIFMVAVKRRE